MSYSMDSNGFLDLSQCYMGCGCDLLLACTISKDYFFSEMQELITWDGKKIKNLQYEDTWWHLVSKHEQGRENRNPLTHLDVERVRRLPLLKKALLGEIDAELYRQINKKGNEDIIQILIDVEGIDYVICLGTIREEYVLRSAYPSTARYVEKVKSRSEYLGNIK